MATDPLHYYAAEWRRTLSGSGLPAVTVEWARVVPTLPAPGDLAGAFDAARDARDYDRSDALLHGLLRCAAGGGRAAHAAAVAVAAQLEPAMGGVATAVLAAVRRAGREVSVLDVRATVAGALWETVRCYPLTRGRAVAANISAEVTKSALRTLDCHERCRGRGIATPDDELDVLTAEVGAGEGLNPSEELVQLLSRALAEHYVTREQSDLVLRRWATGTRPTTVAVIADERGWTRRTANRRCTDAVAALSAAALDLAA